jgi:hypothetical protein
MRTICRAALVVAAAIAWAAPAAAQAPGGAEVLLARPPAEVTSQGQTAARPLAKGARLAPGDRVRTGKDGAVELKLGDGSLVRLAELSDLEIERLDVDASGAPTTSRFNLAAGQARAWVARQVVARVSAAQGDFRIRTPTAVAAVRQTDFAVLHDPDAVTRIYTFAGGVETTSIDKGSVVCFRNRWTRAAPGRDPDPCRVIPLRDKRALLKNLAFQSATVDPGDPDQVSLGRIGAKISGEKMTGGLAFGGAPGRTGREDAAATESPVSTTVTVE